MKKVVNWFGKTKKAVISDGVDSDAVPEQPRNIPRYFPKQKDIYNNFKRYDSCSGNHQNASHACNNIGPEIREESLHVNGPVESATNLNSQLVSHQDGEMVRERDTRNSQEEMQGLVATTGPVNGSQTLSVNSSETLSRVGSSNSMAVQEADAPHDLPSHWVAKKTLEEKKNGGNTYVITISNSTHFHIGTQKTVNYPGAGDNNVSKKDIQFTNISSGQLVALNGNNMFDIKDRLSEDDLLQISLSVRDKWPELARNLGVNESKIEELEELNDSDYNLIVYDILHEYLGRYPETTVGFMVNVLKKSNEIEAIRKITEKR